MSSEKSKDSFSFAGYIADVCFPGKIKREFHTNVRVVADFLELDTVDTVFCWKQFPLSFDHEQVTFHSVKPHLPGIQPWYSNPVGVAPHLRYI